MIRAAVASALLALAVPAAGAGLTNGPAIAAAYDAILDADFPGLDVALRRGRHIDRDDHAWYELLTQAQEHLEAGEEAVGLVHLGSAAALGHERLLRIRGGRERVALEDRHRVAGSAEGERCGQTTDTATHDHHTFGHWRPPYDMVTGVAKRDRTLHAQAQPMGRPRARGAQGRSS